MKKLLAVLGVLGILGVGVLGVFRVGVLGVFGVLRVIHEIYLHFLYLWYGDSFTHTPGNMQKNSGKPVDKHAAVVYNTLENKEGRCIRLTSRISKEVNSVI
jgi:hypothetical protein